MVFKPVRDQRVYAICHKVLTLTIGFNLKNMETNFEIIKWQWPYCEESGAQPPK